jgi:RNA polymerase sigma factor (sigma-70 family)
MRFGRSTGHPPHIVDLREYLDGLYSYGLVLSRNQAEAEDLVQETCLRALRAMERLRPDSNVKSWLFTILRNIWLNQLRQRKTAPDIVDLDSDQHGENRAVDSSKDPYAAYVSDLEREQVRHAIEQLPLEFREIIYCANMKSSPMRTLQRCCNVHSVRSCLDWQGRAPGFGICSWLQPRHYRQRRAPTTQRTPSVRSENLDESPTLVDYNARFGRKREK